jgi:hypothetical protein
MSGRPSEFTPELADLICARLADGQSLRAICRADEMPDKSTVFRWLRSNLEFRDQYTRAKEESADALTDEMLEISDDATNDWMERHNEDGSNIGWQVNGEHIQRSRLRIETRKWLASKLKPKKYGDKVALSGDSEGDPIRTMSEITIRAIDADRPTAKSG